MYYSAKIPVCLVNIAGMFLLKG